LQRFYSFVRLKITIFLEVELVYKYGAERYRQERLFVRKHVGAVINYSVQIVIKTQLAKETSH